jgi:hypothetical protein
MPKNSPHVVLLVVLVAATFAQDLMKRSAFNVPLQKMTLGFDGEGGQFRQVRVMVDGPKEYAVITRLHDMYVKNTRMGTENTHYRESPDRAFVISEFEAKQVNKAVNSFIQTLGLFGRDLKRRRWDRCRYLDAHLPRFLERFYHLVCAARNSPHAFPRVAGIADDEYDISFNSPKTDRRVMMWLEESDYTTRLRIISKELAFQLRRWQKRELDNPKRNVHVAYSAKAEEAYELFVRMYFNLRPPPEVPRDGEHL